MFKNIGAITLTTLIIVSISLFIGLASIYLWGTGNIVGRVAEDVINQELGLDIHLTRKDQK